METTYHAVEIPPITDGESQERRNGLLTRMGELMLTVLLPVVGGTTLVVIATHWQEFVNIFQK